MEMWVVIGMAPNTILTSNGPTSRTQPIMLGRLCSAEITMTTTISKTRTLDTIRLCTPITLVTPIHTMLATTQVPN